MSSSLNNIKHYPIFASYHKHLYSHCRVWLQVLVVYALSQGWDLQ